MVNPISRQSKHKANSGEEEKPMKKARVFCDNPDATEINIPSLPLKSIKTESFSQDRNNVGQINTSSKTANPSRKFWPWRRPPSSPCKGVWLRRCGTWAAEIRYPFTGALIWTGTYTTAEEAFRAYKSRKQDFEAIYMGYSFGETSVPDDSDKLQIGEWGFSHDDLKIHMALNLSFSNQIEPY